MACRSLTKFFICFIAIALSKASYAQPQSNNWYFSPNHGLNFSTGKAVYQSGGQMSRMEGGSCLSDSSGKLLFYTDGITVWNKNHAVMLYGNSLEGGSGSTTQSCLIVPKSSDGLQYYIFTADEQAGYLGFKYSVVDLSKDGGLGEVIQKNILLLASSCEKITAVRHCNKKDYWVITHNYNSDEYYAYQATENGVAAPVISKAGSMLGTYYYNWNAAGQLKASPDGKKLAAANSYNGIDLLDFDNQTGRVSNGVELFGNDNGLHYGVEFSPNSKILYASVKGYFSAADNMRLTSLFQYDLTQNSTASIISSRFTLLTYNGPTDEIGSLQRGPDNRVYLAHYNKPYLSIVNAPDNLGSACNFEEKGLLLPTSGRFNLPNQLNEYGYAPKDSFTVTSPSFCPGSTLQFKYVPVPGITGLQWNFNDPVSGSNNSSTLENPFHQFSQGGTYLVQLIKFGPCSNDTLLKKITLSDLQIELGKDSEVCDKTEITLTPMLISGQADKYRWQDGSSLSSLKAKSAGVYWVEISTAQGCSLRDSLLVSYKPYPVVNIGPDQVLCKGKTLFLDAGNAGSTFLWQDGSKGQQFTVVEAGNYRVSVNLNGCAASDDMVVTEALPPQFSLGPDLELCFGERAELNPKISNVQFKWQDGSTGSNLIASKEGMYVLEASNGCGSSSDTVFLKLMNCQLVVPNAFTPNGDGNNELFRVRNGGNLEFFQMEIYNRWGQSIYKSSNWQQGWDGRVNGLAADNGTYVYMIRYRVRGEIADQLKRGTVVLVR